tara:strand:- start:178 stop:387 length:210 start_codon:yes stop_codon:yes gene_type:complete
MKLAEFIQSEIATNNSTVFDSGWVKQEQVTKATGSSEVKVTSKLFNAKQEGLPTSLAQWLKDGTVTIKQ